jgi:hypothetical protein
MSNQNTCNGVYNVPAQVITGTAETVLLVPAAGLYANYPSPQFPAGSGLSISPPNDITGAGSALDIHAFKLRLVAKVANPGTGNFTLKLYQVPFANLGTISATGSATSTGAPGSGDVIIHTTGTLTQANPSLIAIEFDLMWSSSVARLDGIVWGVNNTSTLIDLGAVSSGGLSSGVATVNQLNFLPSFTFATGNAANSVQVSEFVFERV